MEDHTKQFIHLSRLCFTYFRFSKFTYPVRCLYCPKHTPFLFYRITCSAVWVRTFPFFSFFPQLFIRSTNLSDLLYYIFAVRTSLPTVAVSLQVFCFDSSSSPNSCWYTFIMCSFPRVKTWEGRKKKRSNQIQLRHWIINEVCGRRHNVI